MFKENSWAHGSIRWLELLHRMQPSQESAHTLDDVIAVIFALWLKRHYCLVVDKGAYYFNLILQSEERQVGHANVNLDIDIFVISEQKWLKFGLQAHHFKRFGICQISALYHLYFQKYSTFSDVLTDFHKSFIALKVQEIES